MDGTAVPWGPWVDLPAPDRWPYLEQLFRSAPVDPVTGAFTLTFQWGTEDLLRWLSVWEVRPPKPVLRVLQEEFPAYFRRLTPSESQGRTWMGRAWKTLLRRLPVSSESAAKDDESAAASIELVDLLRAVRAHCAAHLHPLDHTVFRVLVDTTRDGAIRTVTYRLRQGPHALPTGLYATQTFTLPHDSGDVAPAAVAADPWCAEVIELLRDCPDVEGERVAAAWTNIIVSLLQEWESQLRKAWQQTARDRRMRQWFGGSSNSARRHSRSLSRSRNNKVRGGGSLRK